MISYALDLDTEIAVEEKSKSEQLMSARVLGGTLLVRNRLRRSHNYVVKNSGSRTKNVLLEQPVDEDDGWNLVGLEPAEKTRSFYRFAVKAEPGKPATLKVEEEKPVDARVAMVTLADPQEAAIYLSADVVERRRETSHRRGYPPQSEDGRTGRQDHRAGGKD